MHAAAPLPCDPAVWQDEVLRLRARLAEVEGQCQTQTALLEARDRRIEQLLDLIAILKRKRFGQSADRLNLDAAQLNLFDEAELEALLAELQGQLEKERAGAPDADAATPPAEPAAPKAQPKRRPLPAHLPRIERILNLPEADKAALGGQWKLIGYEISEQLGVIPRQFYVISYKRAKYAPCDDSAPGAERGILIAPRFPQLLPKAIADSSLLAEVVAAKFLDALPLYRQERRFAAEGLDIPRQTQAGWLIELAEKLAPIAAGIQRELYRGAVLRIDETRLQVLREPGRANTAKSFMWAFCGGPPGRPVVLFHDSESRASTVPLQFLFPPGGPPDADAEIRWLLQTDGYVAYDPLAARPCVIAHAGCWAHVRRKFVEAGEGRKHTAAAHQAVALIAKLYAVERTLRERSPEERRRERQAHSRPIVAAIKTWLDEKAARVLPQSALGAAVGYALNQWEHLLVFLDHGELEIDNNLTENAIRPFVVGRKNFLFSGSPRGAQASARLYSIIETAKANGHEPRAYLYFLFERLPLATTPAAIEALLPTHLRPDQVPALRQIPSVRLPDEPPHPSP
jgi:transposase